MSSFIPSQPTIGQAFAIVGLALVAPSTYFFRNYNRVLDYVQMFYVFALVFGAGSGVFSLNLQWGFISFMQSFLSSYCNTGQFLCSYGFLISPGVAWFGVALLLLIIFGVLSCCKRNVRYQNFYNFWKGFSRWFMPPLIYYAVNTISVYLQTSGYVLSDISLDWAFGIVILIVVWYVVELIGYKCAQKQEQNIWRKWCDFVSNYRIITVIALAVISSTVNSMAKYFIYGPIVIYDIVFLIKYKFTFRIFERIIFIVEEGVLITVYSLFIFGSHYIYDNNLDLIGLALVIFLELMLFIPKLISYCKNEEEDNGQIKPEREQKTPEQEKRVINRESSLAELVPEPSRVSLNNSRSNNASPSPSRSPKIPPKKR